jgi:hypothetical protein
MHRGWLCRLRQHRRWILHAVVIALSVPVILGLLPNPATSAASALERDLALSICGPYGNGGPAGREQLPSHPDACILCSICAAAAGPAPGDAGKAFFIERRTSAVAPHPLAVQLRPALSWLLFGSPPRGPPSILQV